jgi:hypothetical protein
MRERSERYRATRRLAWDLPEPEPQSEPGVDGRTVAAIAGRWVAELDRYGMIGLLSRREVATRRLATRRLLAR